MLHAHNVRLGSKRQVEVSKVMRESNVKVSWHHLGSKEGFVCQSVRQSGMQSRLGMRLDGRCSEVKSLAGLVKGSADVTRTDDLTRPRCLDSSLKSRDPERCSTTGPLNRKQILFQQSSNKKQKQSYLSVLVNNKNTTLL